MRKTLMLSAALLLAALPAQAQTSPFSLEVKGRIAFPTGDFAEEEQDGSGIKTGWGGGLTGTFQVTPILGIYAGFSSTRFDTDLGELEEDLEGVVEDPEIHITDAGLDAGVRATLPVLNNGLFVRGGLVYHRVGVDLSDELEEILEEFEIEEEDLDSEWSLGYELGAGVLVPLGPRLSVSVGGAYTRYSPEFEEDDGSGEEPVTTAEDDVSFASVEVGLSIRF